VVKVANDAGLSMVEADPYADDPFLKQVFDFDTEWNACIGSQGSEESYLDGYIDAAMELADAIIEKEMYSKRDTLVLPILYNARHAVELTLKFATDRLALAGVINSGVRRRDHNVRVYGAIQTAICAERRNNFA
jgi:hypothetical protein